MGFKDDSEPSCTSPSIIDQSPSLDVTHNFPILPFEFVYFLFLFRSKNSNEGCPDVCGRFSQCRLVFHEFQCNVLFGFESPLLVYRRFDDLQGETEMLCDSPLESSIYSNRKGTRLWEDVRY